LGRKPATAPPPEPPNQDEHSDIDQEDAELSDADFYRQSRSEIEDVRAGITPSMTDAIRPRLQDRPWSKRHKRRDRYGRITG